MHNGHRVFAVASLLASTAAGAVLAQESTSGDRLASAAAEEIIVTARRREEKILDVPISVTAVSGAELERRNISDIMKLQSAVPGLVITGTSQVRNNFGFAIRGQRVQEVQLLNDPAVGLYFAEVVQPRGYGWGLSLYDLQDVQILKGVQGTLFGRNVTAGAVLLEPAHPTHEWKGEIKAEAGNYNMWSTYGMLNMPVVKDKVAIRMNGLYKQRDGFTINVRTGRDYDNLDYWTGRSSILFTPRDNIESLTIFDVLKSEDHGTGSKLTSFRTSSDATGVCAAATGCYAAILSLPGQAPGALAHEYARFQASLALGPRRILGSAFDFDTRWNPYPGREEFNKLWNYGITNKTSIEVGDLTFKNIFGYRHMDAQRMFEYTHLDTFRTGVAALQSTRISVYSEEFQIQGNAFEDRLEWVTGLFGFLERGRENNTSVQLLGGGPGSLVPRADLTNAYQGQWGKGVAISYAVFGAGTFKLSDQFKLSGGLRWNHDQRSSEAANVRLNTQTCRFTNGGVSMGLSRDNCEISNGAAYRSVTWDVTLQYEPDAMTNIYIAQRKGFRSGGLSLRPQEFRAFIPFAPEFARETELGAKREWSLGDTRLATNAALFYTKLTNVQVQVPTLFGGSLTTVTFNTGSQANYGGELEMALNLPFGLNMSGFYAYVNVADTVNRPFSALIGEPKHTLGFAADYTLPFDESVGAVVLGGDIAYRSHIHLDDLDSPFGSDQSGYAISNFYMNWDGIYGSGLGLSLFVSNAFDRVYRIGGVFLDNNFGTGISTYGEPRMFGGSIKYKF